MDCMRYSNRCCSTGLPVNGAANVNQASRAVFLSDEVVPRGSDCVQLNVAGASARQSTERGPGAAESAPVVSFRPRSTTRYSFRPLRSKISTATGKRLDGTRYEY